MKKIKKMLFSIMLSLVLCLPAFTANASQLSDYYGGTWWDLNSQRCYMEITSYSDALSVAISWGHSAFESSEWRMTAFYNPETGKFHYNDCKYSILSSDDYGNYTETIQYFHGTGAIYISSNGYLYWEDYEKQRGINCYFEKDNTIYSQNTDVQLKPGDVANIKYGSNYNGTEMEIRSYGIGGIYVIFSNANGEVWRGEYIKNNYLENGGLKLIFSGMNYLTGANDCLSIEWSSPESIDFPSVDYMFDDIGVGGSYSYDCMLMLP